MRTGSCYITKRRGYSLRLTKTENLYHFSIRYNHSIMVQGLIASPDMAEAMFRDIIGNRPFSPFITEGFIEGSHE